MDASSRELQEDIDCPDIHTLYVYYNQLYFGNQLYTSYEGKSVVEWSPKMTTCGGICYYQKGSKASIIRLSKPLLSLRPSSELKNVLLHEMVHAWQYIEDIREANRQHGDRFIKKMMEINYSQKPDRYKPAKGYEITIYHYMHQEVAHYKTHVWECDTCKKLVKRATNRKPQPADCKDYNLARGALCTNYRCFHCQHRRKCPEGVYNKIAEPEEYKKKQQARKRKSDGTDSAPRRKSQANNSQAITSFFTGKSHVLGTEDDIVKLEEDEEKPLLRENNFGSNGAEGGYQKDRNQNPWDINISLNLKLENGTAMGKIKEEENDDDDLIEITSPSESNFWNHKKEGKEKISPKSSPQRVKCPGCEKMIIESQINNHLDFCLLTAGKKDEGIIVLE